MRIILACAVVVAVACHCATGATAFVVPLRPSSSRSSTVLFKGLRARGAGVAAPTISSSSIPSLRQHQQRLRPSPTARAAAAAAAAPGGSQAGNGLAERAKALMKGVAAGLPLVAFSTISGGVLAGSLHTVTGPDHLAALLPRCIGKRWYQAMRIGAVWGLGHGISAILMGMVAFFLKGRLSSHHLLPKLSLYTEVLIGVSLIAIGLLGLRESAAFEAAPVASDGSPSAAKEASSKAVFLNGLLHGFSWDGTPTLAPALAFDSWLPVMTFLFSYGLGTVVSMSTATSLIGEGTVKVGQALDKPTFPKKLAQGSSVVAILIGLFWTWKALAH